MMSVLAPLPSAGCAPSFGALAAVPPLTHWRHGAAAFLVLCPALCCSSVPPV